MIYVCMYVCVLVINGNIIPGFSRLSLYISPKTISTLSICFFLKEVYRVNFIPLMHNKILSCRLTDVSINKET